MESWIKDAEAIITHTYYVTKEQLKVGHNLPDTFHDDLTALLMQSYPALGYTATKNLVTATERYVRKAIFLESYSGAMFKKFQEFSEERRRKESAKNGA